jgi:uncharacterized protein (TIGR00730 family)
MREIHSVAVYCGSHTPTNPSYIQAAADLGAYIAEHGMTLVFGGSGVGTMKALADAALAKGGKVVGIFTDDLTREILHPGLSEVVTKPTLAERKAEMIRLADAQIALPGGFGTLDELADALVKRLLKRGGHKHPVGVLNVNGYYDHLLAFLDRGVLDGFTTSRLLIVGRTPEELFTRLRA